MRYQGVRSRLSLIDRARELRESWTDAERVMWDCLRHRRLKRWKFRREHQIEGFILDFYCPRLRLGIELDGEPHFEDQGRDCDARRTARLNELGIEILRFENRRFLADPEMRCREIEARRKKREREIFARR